LSNSEKLNGFRWRTGKPLISRHHSFLEGKKIIRWDENLKAIFDEGIKTERKRFYLISSTLKSVLKMAQNSGKR